MYIPTFQYLPPKLSDDCQCKDNPMKAMFCMTGHMLECHFPMDCKTAGCSHLAQYDYTIEEVWKLQEQAHPNILVFADQDCEVCAGSGVKQVTTSISYLFGKQSPQDDLEGEISALCGCVVKRMIEASEQHEAAQALIKFELGAIQATRGVIGKWDAQGKDPQGEGFQYLARHWMGDWGDLDAEDKAMNDRALQEGDRILSRYDIEPGFTIYIITEANRSLTTILLTDEY